MMVANYTDMERWPTIGIMKGGNYADNKGGQLYG